MKRIILIFLTLAVSIALTVAVVYAIVISRDYLDQLIHQLMEQYNVPGVAVSLVQGEVVWSKGYGLADKKQSLPVTADTVFQAASISKAVTSWG